MHLNFPLFSCFIDEGSRFRLYINSGTTCEICLGGSMKNVNNEIKLPIRLQG